MKEFAILKKITDNQKTISTKKLAPLIASIQKAYIQTSKKVARQENTIQVINNNYNRMVRKKEMER